MAQKRIQGCISKHSALLKKKRQEFATNTDQEAQLNQETEDKKSENANAAEDETTGATQQPNENAQFPPIGENGFLSSDDEEVANGETKHTVAQRLQEREKEELEQKLLDSEEEIGGEEEEEEEGENEQAENETEQNAAESANEMMDMEAADSDQNETDDSDHSDSESVNVDLDETADATAKPRKRIISMDDDDSDDERPQPTMANADAVEDGNQLTEKHRNDELGRETDEEVPPVFEMSESMYFEADDCSGRKHDQPATCPKCESLFTKRYNMLRHSKKCNGKQTVQPAKYDQPATCPKCESLYTKRHNMLRHLKKCEG